MNCQNFYHYNPLLDDWTKGISKLHHYFYSQFNLRNGLIRIGPINHALELGMEY